MGDEIKNLFRLKDEEQGPHLPQRVPSLARACTINFYLALPLLIAPIIAITVIALSLNDSFARNAFLWVSGFIYCLFPLPIAVMLLRGICRVGDVASLINRSNPVTVKLTLAAIPNQRIARSEIDLIISSGLFDSKKLFLEKKDEYEEKLTLAWNTNASLAAQYHKIRLWAFTKNETQHSIGSEDQHLSIDSYWDPDGLVALETTEWLAIVPSLFTEVYQPISSWVPKQ